MIKENALLESFELIKFRNVELLFSPSRIDRNTIPKGMYLYEVAYDDDNIGNPDIIRTHIFCDFLGSIISNQQFPEFENYYVIQNNDCWEYSGKFTTLKGWQKAIVEFKIRDTLYTKMKSEYEVFKCSLLKKSPEEILIASYENVIKYETLSLFHPDDKRFSLEDINVLIGQEFPLDFLYQKWMKIDLNINELIQDSIRLSISELGD